MAEKINSLKEIKTSAAASAEVRKPKRDKQAVLTLPVREKTPLPAYGLNRVKAM